MKKCATLNIHIIKIMYDFMTSIKTKKKFKYNKAPMLNCSTEKELKKMLEDYNPVRLLYIHIKAHGVFRINR